MHVFEMRITLKFIDDSGTILFNHKSLSIVRRLLNVYIGRCLNIKGQMMSNPAVGEKRGEIVSDNF